MTEAAGNVLGIRLRLGGGRKLAIRGGKEGIFLPEGIDWGGRLLVSEGPRTRAALLDLGFSAVGRPSCTGGARLLCELLRQRRPAEVTIVADGDQPGRRGAESLAAVLVAYTPACASLGPRPASRMPESGKRSGATWADVAGVIDAARSGGLWSVWSERRVHNMESDNGLSVRWIAGGANGKGTLTALLNGSPVHGDELNLRQDKARLGFISTLRAKCPGVTKSRQRTGNRTATDRDQAGDETAQTSAADPAGEPDASELLTKMPESIRAEARRCWSRQTSWSVSATTSRPSASRASGRLRGPST